jgi:hypothetical protein
MRCLRLPGEVFFPELGDAARGFLAARLLAAELDPADLPGDRLEQVGELTAPTSSNHRSREVQVTVR